ncbi:hypothetical protein ACEPAG_4102 [Sanghuangporus baumii]
MGTAIKTVYNVGGNKYDVALLESDSDEGQNAKAAVERSMARAESSSDGDSIAAAKALFDLAKGRKEMKTDSAKVLERLTEVETKFAILQKAQEVQGSQMAEALQEFRANMEIVENRLTEFSCRSLDVEDYVMYSAKQPEKLSRPAPQKSPTSSYAFVASTASVSSASARSGSVSSGSRGPGSAISKRGSIVQSISARSHSLPEGSICPDLLQGSLCQGPVGDKKHEAGYWRPNTYRDRMTAGDWSEFWKRICEFGDVYQVHLPPKANDEAVTNIGRKSEAPQKDNFKTTKDVRVFSKDQVKFWRFAMWQFQIFLMEDLDEPGRRSRTRTLTSMSAMSASALTSRRIKLPSFFKKKDKEEREKEEREKREEKKREVREKMTTDLTEPWVEFAREVYNKHAKGFTREHKEWVLKHLTFALALISKLDLFVAACIDVDQLREMGNIAVHSIAFPLEVDKGKDHDWLMAIDQVPRLEGVHNEWTAKEALEYAYKAMKDPFAVFPEPFPTV